MEIWVGGLLALAGTVLGSLAAFFGPMIVAARTQRHQAERDHYERREQLLAEFIDNFLETAQFAVPWTAKEAQEASARMRRAQMQLQLLLGERERPAEEYLTGLVRMVASIQKDTNARRAGVEHGGQELIEWHKGRPVELRPFRPVGYGTGGELLLQFLDRWP